MNKHKYIFQQKILPVKCTLSNNKRLPVNYINLFNTQALTNFHLHIFKHTTLPVTLQEATNMNPTKSSFMTKSN